MIVGIIGSRRRNSPKDFASVIITLRRLERDDDDVIEKIVTGDCDEGGDEFARSIADMFGYEIEVKHIIDPETKEPMDFNNHRWFNYFTICNIYYKRDTEIAKEEMDYLIALVTQYRTGGTEYTIKQFKKFNKDWDDKLIIL